MALSLVTWSSSRQSKVKLIVKSVVLLYPYRHQGSATVAELPKEGWK